MIADFQNFIIKNQLFKPDQRILLAVSGGLDSSVMAHLFAQAHFTFGIAHCNFNLRDNDSDGDEKFVSELAANYHVPFFTIKFNTKSYAAEHNMGIQEAARALRYDWFSKLIQTENFDYVATAHHKDDHVETFFLNVLRGCGISGLHGIRAKRDFVIRPLLFASRKELEQYAMEHNLSHREDVSNQECKYTRNKIRHQLIPIVKNIQPNFLDIFSENIERFSEAEKIYQKRIDEVKKQILSHPESDIWAIDIQKLKNTEAPKTFLYEMVSAFGFKKDVLPNILNALDNQSGKRFFSESHELIKDRDFLFIHKRPEPENQLFFIEKNAETLSEPLSLTIKIKSITEDFSISKNKNTACLDLDTLTFPLTLRKPKQGDRFTPFGMKTQKKLSDFCVDVKMSRIEKEKLWLLCSKKEIVWVVGWRINDHYSITETTKTAFVIEKLKI